MAGKKAKGEIETIRTELNELTEAIYALREHVVTEAAASAATALRDRQPVVASPFLDAQIAANGDVESGEASSAGYVRLASADDEPLAFHWSADRVPMNTILEQETDGLARLLAAIGHRQRLAILKAILAKPTSASELVTGLKLGTTGAAYHHLNVLQGVDLVTQEERGIFSIQPQKVGTLLSILASPFATTTIGAVPDDETSSSADDDASPKRKGKKKSGD